LKGERSTTLPYDGGPKGAETAIPGPSSGERAVRTLPFDLETFRMIADRFFLHGSISKVVNRADVPIFTHASVWMGGGTDNAYPAFGSSPTGPLS
jgi:hypothetical protein